jgi:hypothetical protein
MCSLLHALLLALLLLPPLRRRVIEGRYPSNAELTPSCAEVLRKLGHRKEPPQSYPSHHAAKLFLHRDDRTGVVPL